MAENDLKVIQKAKELATHTLKVTSNANRYPKKYRFSLVDKMQNKSMEIYEMLFEANRTDIKNYKRDRLEMQTKAITYCDELLFYIEMSYELNIISEKSVEYWSKLVSDVKHMAIAWRTKDRQRYIGSFREANCPYLKVGERVPNLIIDDTQEQLRFA